jgi:hypothetical protein
VSERWPELDSEQPNLEAEPAGSDAADDGSAFMAELVRSMQAAAGLERARISDDIERRRRDHIDQIQARRASEAGRMRELAEEDTQAIEAWVEEETTRIRLERERRTSAVREDLDLSLAEHGSKIDREIEGVETAIARHRAEVEAFFDDLDRATDPVQIAQQAAHRPVFPALDPVAASDADEAPTDADLTDERATEPILVGVMDTDAAAELVESWAATPETIPEPVPARAFDDIDQGSAQDVAVPERAEPVTASMSASHGGSLFESVVVHRPMSWLRRDSHNGDRANDED